MSNQKQEVPNTEDYWPCACVKRDRAGNMTHIKLNHNSVPKCRKCKATRANAERFKREHEACGD
jgi:hypothetical protein